MIGLIDPIVKLIIVIYTTTFFIKGNLEYVVFLFFN